MPLPLTARQQEIYEFLADEIQHRGRPPTIREICNRFGMASSNGAREALEVLVQKGCIRRHSRVARGIELVEGSGNSSSSDVRAVSVVSSIDPEDPFAATREGCPTVLLDARLLPEGHVMAIRVGCDAMSELLPGDLTVAASSAPVEDGCLVVAVISDTPCVRRFKRKGRAKYLAADDPEIADVKIGRTNPPASIICPVVAVVRQTVGRPIHSNHLV